MARLFYTGFETGDYQNNGGVYNSPGSSFTFSDSVRRTGTYSLQLFVNVGVQNWINQVLEQTPNEVYVRFAYRHTAAAMERSDDWSIMRLAEDGTSHIEIVMDKDTTALKLKVKGTVEDTNFIAIPQNTWVIIESYSKIANSGGVATVKLNGTTVLSYNGDTCHGSNEYVEVCSLGGNFDTHYFDDWAINDEDDSYQNSWIGLGGVFYLKPNADGTTNDWTPSAGSVNYEMVDETPPDNATTYVQAVTSGDIDLYEIEDTPTYIDSVNCVQVIYQAALAESGYNETTDLVRIGTVNYSGTAHTIVPITPDFAHYEGTIHYLNPSSGSAWGTADINGMEAGLEITV